MRSHRCPAVLLVVGGILFVFGCHSDPTTPSTGFILVTVTDVSSSSVAGYEIRITPGDLMAITDDQGVTRFEVDWGIYTVHARLPGPGPALRDHNVPITVLGGETVPVKLQACFLCV
jgi:hypothetical protein